MRTSARAAFACALAAGAFTTAAGAQTVHKCTVDGKVSYSEMPCQAGTASVLRVPVAPPPDKAAQADLKRMKKESAALEKERLRREAADVREAEHTNRINAARQQRCAKLKLDRKWADEDLKRAQPQYEERARLKAQRAAEKLAVGCTA